MNKLFKVLEVLFESYMMGLIILIISAIILGLCGVTIDPVSGILKWHICMWIIGLLAYALKALISR